MNVTITVQDDQGKEIFSADRELGGDDRVAVEPVHDEAGEILAIALMFNEDRVFFPLKWEHREPASPYEPLTDTRKQVTQFE